MGETTVQEIQQIPKGIEGIGSRLLSLIRQMGLSQSQFANEVGVSTGYISDIVNGNKTPGLEFLISVSEKFAIDIGWLISGAGAASGTPIDTERFRFTKVKVAVAKSIVVDENPTARALLPLIRAGNTKEMRTPRFKAFLDQISLENPDLDLTIDLYNRELEHRHTRQPFDVFEVALQHYELRKPMDTASAFEKKKTGPVVQHNKVIGGSLRVAGVKYIENQYVGRRRK